MMWHVIDYAHMGSTLRRNMLSVPVTPDLWIMSILENTVNQLPIYGV
jgi:hypothetical protein